MSGALVIARERLGLAGLEALAALEARVALVICPDDGLNSRIVAPAALDAFCRMQQWPCLQVAGVKTPGVEEAVRKAAPDLLYVIGWSEVIPLSILDAVAGPRVGFHGTLLPRHRGCAPIPWAIIHGLRETGMTMFHLNKGVDDGPIISQAAFGIGAMDTAADLYERSCQALHSLLLEHHEAVLDGAPGNPQDERLASYWPRRRPEDGIMDWKASARSLFDWVRALTHPFPGAFTWMDGRKVMVWAADESDRETPEGKDGVILGTASVGVDVGTGCGVLRILEAQPEGADRISGQALGEHFIPYHGRRFTF